MDEKYVLVSLEDEKTMKIAESIKNKTSRKILDLLAEKEMSETDIASELKIPINTAEYSIKKLLGAGLIEKSKNYLWSGKGKRIPFYKTVKKFIVISPRKSGNVSDKIKSILPVAFICALISVFIKYYFEITSRISNTTPSFQSGVLEKATDAVGGLNSAPSSAVLVLPPEYALWFLAGAAIAILIFMLINWRKL